MFDILARYREWQTVSLSTHKITANWLLHLVLCCPRLLHLIPQLMPADNASWVFWKPAETASSSILTNCFAPDMRQAWKYPWHQITGLMDKLSFMLYCLLGMRGITWSVYLALYSHASWRERVRGSGTPSRRLSGGQTSEERWTALAMAQCRLGEN